MPTLKTHGRMGNFHKERGGWQPGVNTEAYFPFSGDFIDQTNNKTLSVNDCTISGGAANINSAYSTMLLDNPIGGSDMTISCWYYYDSYNTTGGRSTLFCRTGGNNHHLLIVGDSGNGTPGTVGFWNGNFYTNGAILTPQNWYYITIVKSGLNEKVYVNSHLVLDSDNSFDNNDCPLGIIGNYDPSGNQGAIGKISELIIENTLWTPQEITSYFNNTESSYNPGPLSGIILFDEGTCNTSQSNYYDQCLEFSSDGMHFYTSNNACGGPYQIDLATAWDITTATNQYELSGIRYCSDWNGNGTPHRESSGMAFWNSYGGTITRFTVSTQRDATTATVDIQDTNSIWGSLGRGWKFVDNGNKIIAAGGFGQTSDSAVNIGDLTTPYDITSINLSSVKCIAGLILDDVDFFMSNDGLYLYLASPSIELRCYTLSTARDVSTASLTNACPQYEASGIYIHGDKIYLKYRFANVKQFEMAIY